jgi:hypothetical protein
MPAMSLDVIAGVHSPEKSGPLMELGAVIKQFDCADVAGIKQFDCADVAGIRTTQVIENGYYYGEGGEGRKTADG